MRPTVISPTIQEFCGVRYYRCGAYFQNKGVRLHLAVWWHHRGLIPRGCHIHHKDNDRSNNRIGNLECLTAQEHRRLHGPASGEHGRKYLKLAQVAAAAWHRSADGQRWHAEHNKNLRGLKRPRVAMVCQQCGKNFMAADTATLTAKFCGPNCKAKAFRRRHKGE